MDGSATCAAGKILIATWLLVSGNREDQMNRCLKLDRKPSTGLSTDLRWTLDKHRKCCRSSSYLS